MSTVTFDTHKSVKDLQSAGIAPEQAEAFVRAQQEILSQAFDSTLATRSDLERLERRLIEYDGKFALLQWMIGFNLAFTMAVLWRVFS